MLKKLWSKLFKKKYKIILIRHGESEGNLNPDVYMTVPDHRIKLTERGIVQAIDVGKEIKKIVNNDPLDVYVSPYARTKETWTAVRKGLDRNNLTVHFDPKLREQQCTMFRSHDHRREKFAEQKKFSKFFFRFGKGGESGADVHNRVFSFLLALRMDNQLLNNKNDCLIVAHEIALRSILMILCHLNPDEFDELPYIENCAPIVLETEDFKTAKIIKEMTMGNQDLIKFLDR